MSGSVGAYLAQVDHLLAAGQSLFATPVTAQGLNATGRPLTPAPPSASGLTMGVANSDRYQSDWRTATELDQHTDAQRDAARSDHQRAAAAASAVRQTARAQAEAIAPSAGSPAGGRLLVATMDERLEAMQRHLTTAKAQQQLFAVRLRQLAAAYGLTAPPLAIPPIARFSIPKRLAGMAIPAVHARRQRTPTSAKPPIGGVPHLTRDSTLRQVAACILWEAHRRGYSREQAIAILSTAMRESALNPKAVCPNGLWEGTFQQGASYRDRRDPNGAIAAFFDRLGMKGGPSSPDIWKSIFWLQQRPGEPSAEAAYAHGRKQYLAEIRSPLPQAIQLYTELVG